MKNFLQTSAKLLGFITLGTIVFMVAWLVFSWISQAKMNQKARDFYSASNASVTNANELFNIAPKQFFCLEQIYQSGPSERHNYSALIKAGIDIGDVPSYNKWPFEMILWDPDDIRVMALSPEGKLSRKLILSRGVLSYETWPYHFGCFESSHPIEITFTDPQSKTGLKLNFSTISKN